ncbi:MAG TPA: ATP-binding protein [Nocardioidaceae bacterium]|nr:ATP-binding protein [Nocardioidaceae bacterium]
MIRPLDRLGSIKTKLGVLVAVTVAVAAVASLAGERLGWSPLYTIPAAVLVALGVTQLLARGMTSPLRAMTAAARTMATGDYSRRVCATSRDEVGDLARAFNTMAADLEAVDQQRRDLVANVSHELRTPVSALRAVLENLVDGVSEPDPATLRAALEQSERLSRLVADLLDLSRVDAGIAPMDLEPVLVEPLLRSAVKQAQVSGHPIGHLVDVHPADLAVHADRERLHQLLANLLDNAGRHSPHGGTVEVRASAADAATAIDGTVVLDVLDDGPGIAAADRAGVFERFTTGAHPGTDGGTGLGLAIARWVTDLHGGSIEVADAERGCHIRVTLPHDRRIR